jgi:hypothetical protein
MGADSWTLGHIVVSGSLGRAYTKASVPARTVIDVAASA